jgi:hypothetical protein
MNKLILLLVLFLCTGTLFGQNVFKKRLDAQAGINVTGVIKLNSDTISSIRVQRWNNALSDTVSLSSLVPLFSDSTVKYVTPKSMASYISVNSSNGGIDSIRVAAANISDGNIYLNSIDKRIHYRTGTKWYRLAVQDSISTVADGIIAYWKLNEASGSVLDALSLFPGTVSGSPTRNVAGKLSTCYTFASASSQSIGMGTNASLRPTSGLTVAFWIKTSTAENGMVVSNYGLTGSGPYYSWGYEIAMVANGYIYFDTYQGSNGSGCGTNTTANIANNTWHFVVCTYDNVNARIYVDGTLSATSSTGSGIMYYQASAFTIAARSGGGVYYNGSLDEVGLWSRALTATEVTTLYNAGTGKTYPF